MNRVGAWVRERIPVSGIQLRELTNEPVPHHLKHWWFCLGGAPAYLFVVQIVTGMALLMCILMMGFTGYSLVFEQLSYWGATVAANISDAVPVMGPILKSMLLGGDAVNDRTLSRFYILHAVMLPTTMVLLLTIHIALIRLHGVTELEFPGDKDKPSRYFDFFPDHLLTEVLIGLVLMILLSVLATVLPAEMGLKADPLTTPEVIKPEWWFYVSFRWLKLFSLTFAVLSTGFIITAMFLWPWMDKGGSENNFRI